MSCVASRGEGVPWGRGSAKFLAGACPATKVIAKVIFLIGHPHDLICSHILCPVVPGGSWGGEGARDSGVFWDRLTLTFTGGPQLRTVWAFCAGSAGLPEDGGESEKVGAAGQPCPSPGSAAI